MTARRVLVLYQDSLLAQGVLSLLRQQVGLEVSARQLEDSRAEEFMGQFAPDVVIIDREDFAGQTGVTIDQLLREGPPHVKVVDISSRNDLARVYEGHEIKLAKFDDLLATLASHQGN